MQTIYTPRGRAGEYALLALELFCSDGSDKGGCPHRCGYCYVPACLKTTPEAFRTNVRPRPGLLPELLKRMPKYEHELKRVFMSFFSDPYPFVGVESLTREVLSMLRAYDVPFTILTKGGLRAAKDFDYYGPRDAFGCTLTTMKEKAAQHVEPGAAPTFDRVAALSEAKERGIHTWVSLEPVLDPEESLRVILSTRDLVDHFMVGKLNHDPKAEAKINWRWFALSAVIALEKYNKSYYIKKDLARYLDGTEYHNTDDRFYVPDRPGTP